MLVGSGRGEAMSVYESPAVGGRSPITPEIGGGRRDGGVGVGGGGGGGRGTVAGGGGRRQRRARGDGGGGGDGV